MFILLMTARWQAYVHAWLGSPCCPHHDNRHNEYRDNDKLDVDPTTPMHVLFGRNFGERSSRGQFLVRHVQVLTFQSYVEERGSCPTHATPAAMPTPTNTENGYYVGSQPDGRFGTSNVSSRSGQGFRVSLPGEVASTAVALARAKKRNNALVALLCAIVPAIFLAYRQQPHSRQWIVGLAIGLIWGNGFEYAYHRWLLHWPKSIFGRGHLEHHRTAGAAEQAEHITFGRNPLNVVALFLGNGILLLLIEFLFKVRIAPGVLIGWAVYLITLEEIHWRLHMESWLPPGLRFARAYHLSHHDIPNRRYNVFLPLFDFLLGNNKLPTNRLVTESASRHSSR